jgi:aspartokinase-like uncharacterized kinase
MSESRVIKVGGSLFDWPLLPLALDAWLSGQPSATNVLIAGGGSLVDTIRRASRTFSLDDETAHWLSIDAMGINATFLAGFLPDAELISTYRELRSAVETDSCRRIVFDAREFLSKHESKLSGCVLPHNWSVTSDSIAARLAAVLAADELVLLKSADPSGETTTALVNAGFVDRYFLAFDDCDFRRRFVNLRQAAKCPVEGEI